MGEERFLPSKTTRTHTHTPLNWGGQGKIKILFKNVIKIPNSAPERGGNADFDGRNLVLNASNHQNIETFKVSYFDHF